MSDNSGENEHWTIYTAAQHLPAVLNDPNRGKQSNFFTKTWGDSFVDRTEIPRSPFLTEITYAHLDSYLRKYGKRLKRHVRLAQVKLEDKIIKSEEPELVDFSGIPEVFLKQNFNLNDPKTFSNVFDKNGSRQSEHELQEQLSHYLDKVEMQIAKQVSQKSGAFFHAMTSHDTIMEQMGTACAEVRSLRKKVQKVDKTLAKDSLRLIGLARSKTNHIKLLDKLKLMATVLQTQPTIQLLLSSSDYVAALELISSTQEVLAKELAGVTSLRHLPSQLKEMLKLIDKMLTTDFERYAAADLHRPLEAALVVMDTDRLVSLVAGLLRQNHLNFLEMYKQEAVTACQTLLKQLMIEQLANDDSELCLTGSGETPPSLDSTNWIRVLSLASDALVKLLQKVKAVHDVVKDTADGSAGLSNSSLAMERFLSIEDHERVKAKLKDLLVCVCDYYNDRLASLVGMHSDKQTITSTQITELSKVVDRFTEDCEKLTGRCSAALKAAFKIQAGNYVHKFHSQRRTKLTLLLDAERWKCAQCPKEIQILVDRFAEGSLIKSLPSSPIDNGMEKSLASSCLKIDSQEFYTVGTVLILIRLISEYCVCAYDLKMLAVVIGKNLAELLRCFNSRSCQLILGAGALKTAGLNTITTTNLALASRSLQLVLWIIPHVKVHFEMLTKEKLSCFDVVENDIINHIQQLENKVLSIMKTLIGEQLNEWDAKPPVPSSQFKNISRHLIKLHEAVSAVLPEEQVSDLYQVIHKDFKTRIRENLIKRNIVNNGGPQHGLVTTELTFYLETLRTLRVLEKSELSDVDMEEIWLR